MTAATIAMMPAALALACVGVVVITLALMWLWDSKTRKHDAIGVVGLLAGSGVILSAVFVVGRSAGWW
jgi:drug/metabolite transporter superfamily protein YnfA